MSDTPKTELNELVDRFIDGDITAHERQALLARAAEDHALGAELASAVELQRALASLPGEKAPSSLERKLQAIPHKHRQRNRLASWLLRPQWAMAAALLLVFAAGSGIYQQHRIQQQQAAELAQARQDLELVLGYLEKINRRTNHQIQATVSEVTSEPVARITTETLQTQLQPRQEFEL